VGISPGLDCALRETATIAWRGARRCESVEPLLPAEKLENAMASTLRFIEILALGTWVGGIIFFSFVVAPGAFGVLGSRDQAGTMVGFALGRLHWIGIVAGLIYVVALVAERRSIAAIARPAAILVVLMIALTFYSQKFVTSRLAGLRREMVSVDATPRDNPLRVEFDSLHQWSVRIEGTVLLLGLAGLFLTVRNFSPHR
jgi:hypothetical protein